MNRMQMANGLTTALMISNLLTNAAARRLLLRGGSDPVQDPVLHLNDSHGVALLATSPESKLGFPHPYNINPERTPSKHFYVGCIHDLQTHQRRYYHESIPKEDREKMTADVCLNFCMTVSGTQYYGLHGKANETTGNQCYCTPFFQNDTLRTNLYTHHCDKPCEGDLETMCGGEDMVSMWTVLDPENLPAKSDDVGECGGPEVRHQTCRSRAYAERDCRYVYKADIAKCGVQNWGCYPTSSLPQECQDPSAALPPAKQSTMAEFASGVCGRQNGRGGFKDTHHTIDEEVGQEGTHLKGTYTPEKCRQKCLEDDKCMGAEQPKDLNEHGKAWCVLFYLTEAVTEIGLAQNDNFNCALKSFS